MLYLGSIQEGESPQVLSQYYRTHVHLVKSQRGGGGGDDDDAGGGGGKFFGGGAKAAAMKNGVRTLSWWHAFSLSSFAFMPITRMTISESSNQTSRSFMITFVIKSYNLG